MRKYEFNDIQGERNRLCNFAIIYNGVYYTPEESMKQNLAIFKRLWTEKNGKWSNSQWEVTVNSASLIVCRAPFEIWSDDLEICLNHVSKSCVGYIGYEPTREECILFFSKVYTEKYEKLKAIDKIELL